MSAPLWALLIGWFLCDLSVAAVEAATEEARWGQ